MCLQLSQSIVMIGIFGGTFDPVHYGHIKPLLAVKQALNLKQVRIIPNRIPPHRKMPWLSVEQRLALLTTAIKDYADVTIDQREINRAGPSYMVETLISLKEDFPGERFVLIIGMDVFYGITTWHKWQDLFELCHLVVTTRPDFLQSEIASHIEGENHQWLADKITDDGSELMKHETGKILLQSVPQLDISATQIRDKLQSCAMADDEVDDCNSESFEELMPPSVYRQLSVLLKNGQLDFSGIAEQNTND